MVLKVRKVYAAMNAILSHSRFVSDIIRLSALEVFLRECAIKFTLDIDISLMESYVLPILTYALEAVSLTNSMIREFSVCCNNVYRRYFWYKQMGIF